MGTGSNYLHNQAQTDAPRGNSCLSHFSSWWIAAVPSFEFRSLEFVSDFVLFSNFFSEVQRCQDPLLVIRPTLNW
jgi:hypothetical protein